MKKGIRWIVETAVLLALLIVVQWVTKPLGTLVTGSAVNFLLIAATLLVGRASGFTVALVSPFLAMVLGVVPLPIWFVPAVAIGNAALVAVYSSMLHALRKWKGVRKYLLWIIVIAASSVVKFAVLYATVNWVIMPLLSVAGIAAKAPAAIFATSQMVTAAIGGMLAVLVIPTLLKALRR